MSDIIFNCVHCDEPFSVTEQHLGTEVSCPSCDAGNELPDANDYYGTDTAVGMQPIEDEQPAASSHAAVHHGQTAAGLPDFFTDEEWTKLAQSDPDVYNAVYDWSARPSWRFAFMAAMLRSRLASLHNIVEEPLEFARTIRFLRSRSKVNAAMAAQADKFIYLSSNLNQQLGTYLWYTLFRNGLEPHYEFFGRIEPWIEKLGIYHAELEELPAMTDAAAEEMQLSMATWVPWIWQSIDRLADRLEHDSNYEQTHESLIRLQVSIAPPSLHAFFIAQAKFIG